MSLETVGLEGDERWRWQALCAEQPGKGRKLVQGIRPLGFVQEDKNDKSVGDGGA